MIQETLSYFSSQIAFMQNGPSNKKTQDNFSTQKERKKES